jgi:hypothetical protein
MSTHRLADSPRLVAPGWLLAVAVFAATPWLSADVTEHRGRGTTSTNHNAPLASSTSTMQDGVRVREGAKIDKTGCFRKTGDRVTFYADDGKTRYRGLENLMLERIARTIEENPGQLEWQVTGVVTEYRGANFLLVTHAVLRTNGSRTPSQQLTRLGGR